MILDGRAVADSILQNLTKRTHILLEKFAIQPHLAVVRVGNDPATSSYIKQKEKVGREIGALISVYQCPATVTEKKLLETIDFLQTKGDIHGIILQLPLPRHLDAEKLLLEIHPDKDIDGFRPNSQFTVPVAKAVVKLLEIPFLKEAKYQSFMSWLSSKRIVVIGKGKTGGQPITDLLRKNEGEVTEIDSKTPNPMQITQDADILICAVGKKDLITHNMVKKDAILLGVGMSMDNLGNFSGDYNENDIKDQAGWYTPIPGGVGPVNVACLMENLVIAAENVIKN